MTAPAQPSILSSALELDHSVTLAISADREVGRVMLADAVAGALLGKIPFLGQLPPAARHTTIYGVDPGTQRFLSRVHSQAVEDKQLVFASPPPDALKTDFLGGEARALFSATVAAAVSAMDAVVVSVPPCSSKAAFSSEALALFVAAAKARARTVIMLFIGLPDHAVELLPYVFDDVVLASGCEAEDGYPSAYLLKPAPGALSEAINWKPVVVSSRVTSESRIERIIAPGTAKTYAMREIIRMADAGKSLSTIGKQLGLHKSTIKRRLDGLPCNPKRKLADED